MLIWPCDIIIAGDYAEFSDNTVSMGVGGVEFFTILGRSAPARRRKCSSPLMS